MTGQVIIVTGASRGIGEATVRQLRMRGCHVVGIARSESALSKLALEKAGTGTFTAVPGDVTDDAVLQRAVDTCLERFGRLDGLVLNAGIIEPIVRIGDLGREGETAALKRLFEVNFFSAVSLVQKALPALRKTSGRVVLVSSGAASHAYHGWLGYGSSKAALNMLAQTLALEEPAVTALAVRPGVVDTAMIGVVRSEGSRAMPPEALAFFEERSKAGELIAPHVAGGVLAALVLGCPADWSGRFVSWDDPELAPFRQ